MLLRHPNASSISWGGTTFSADERGVFDVPEEAGADLAAFGLTPYVETAPKAPPQPPPPLQPPAAPQARPVPQRSNDDLKATAAELGLDIEGLDRPALIQAVTAALKPKD